jgi:hypothetical protein
MGISVAVMGLSVAVMGTSVAEVCTAAFVGGERTQARRETAAGTR